MNHPTTTINQRNHTLAGIAQSRRTVIGLRLLSFTSNITFLHLLLSWKMPTQWRTPCWLGLAVAGAFMALDYGSMLVRWIRHGNAATVSLLALAALSVMLTGCGGQSSAPPATNPATGQPVTLAEAQKNHDAAVAGFIAQHPAQPLTVVGKVDVGGGEFIDVADGKTYYSHTQASVAYQDASQLHGTVMVSIEDGIVAPGLYQTVVQLPHVVGITEATDTNNFTLFSFAPFCTANGVTLQVVGYDSTAPGSGGQTLFAFSIIDPPSIYDQPEKHWPNSGASTPIYLDAVAVNVSVDLCGFVTAKPTVTMKF